MVDCVFDRSVLVYNTAHRAPTGATKNWKM
jgi:hypothetical protein